MTNKKNKRSVFSLIMALTMMIVMVFPASVFAEGEEPPTEEAPPTEEIEIPPTEEIEVPPAEEVPPQETPESQLPDPQVTVEPVEEKAVETPAPKEDLSEIVEVLAESDVVLVDGEGESLCMASEDTAEALAVSDPFYFDTALSAWVGYSDTGVCANRVNPANCHNTTTPVQDAVDGAILAGATDIFIVTGTSMVFNEDLTLNASTSGFTLMAIKNAWDAEGGVATGLATLNSISLSSNVSLLNIYAPIIYVNPGASIQDGISYVQDNGTVNVAEGTFVENIIIDKPLELAGAGQDKTTIHPGFSGAKPDGGGSMPNGSSNMVLVQANNVTIHDLTLDGDNPALTSTINIDGANIDARNGIITNHFLGTFNDLEVYNTTVENIYLRGIYASSYGTFNFHDNIVQNVKGEDASIAMMNFGGSGIFANNYVNNVNDGIVSNWSQGTQYLNNHVVNAGTGIHTDNNQTVGDSIIGNLIEDCSWGIFTFVPYVPITVEGNTVLRSDIGLTAASSANGTNGSTTFSNNTVDAQGRAKSYGGYVTSEAWYYFYNDVNANFFNNSFLNSDYGLYFENMQSLYTRGFTGSSNIFTEVKENIFDGITVALADNTADANAKEIGAFYNYWGDDDDSTFSTLIFGNILYDPWLLDHDGDRVFEASDSNPVYTDNCPDAYNPNQVDTDGDGFGDVCDPTPNGDNDSDGVDNLADNCPNASNPGQLDSDNDGIGDACDPTPEGPGQAGLTAGAGPRARFGQLIPVTGSEQMELTCDSECVAFELPDGSVVEFCGLCGYSVSLSVESEGTIPFDMPDGVQMMTGFTLNLFDKDGNLTTELPDGATVNVSYPLGGKDASTMGVQVWDPIKEEWLSLVDLTADGDYLQAPIGWPGTILLVE